MLPPSLLLVQLLPPPRLRVWTCLHFFLAPQEAQAQQQQLHRQPQQEGGFASSFPMFESQTKVGIKLQCLRTFFFISFFAFGSG